VSPSKPSGTKRNRGEGAVFQRCDLDRGCPPREPVLNADGSPSLTKSGKPRMKRPKHTCKGMWVARLDLGPGEDGTKKQRRPQRASATKTGALDLLDEMKKQYAVHGTVSTKQMTVERWLEKWLKEIVLPNKDPGTYRAYQPQVKVITHYIGRHRLEALEPSHIRKMYESMKKDGRAGSRPNAHAVLRNALNAAIREGLLFRNVVKLVSEPAGSGKRGVALTSEQAALLLDYVAMEIDGIPVDPHPSRWDMALYTASRPGECLGLTRDRVDLDADVMDLSWKLERITFIHGCGDELPGERWPCGKRHGGRCPERELRVPDGFEYQQLHGGLTLSRPKTDSGVRLMPIPPPLHDSLEIHLSRVDGPNPHNLVWHEPDGKPIELGDDTIRWNAHLKACGLPPVRLYDARHTTITLLMEEGVDPTIIQAIAGHSSLVPQEAYKHANVRHLAQALGKVAVAMKRGGPRPELEQLAASVRASRAQVG
jgi:integrase